MSRRPRHRRSQGFTLLELLVVLVLMGIIVGFAVAALRGPDTSQRLDDEAKRLRALLQLASEQAILQVSVIGWRMTADGYEFVTRSPSDWQVMDKKPFQARSVAEDIRIALAQSAKQSQNDSKMPQVLMFSDGTMTPNTLTLRGPTGEQRIVQAHDSGDVTIEFP